MRDIDAFAAATAQAFRFALKLRTACYIAADLKSAVEHQTVISIACGILMGQNRCTLNEAMAIQTDASDARRRPLHDLAEDIVTNLSGHTPDTFFPN